MLLLSPCDCYTTFHPSFSFHCFTLTAGFDGLTLSLRTHAGGCFESLYLAHIRAIRRYEPSAFVEECNEEGLKTLAVQPGALLNHRADDVIAAPPQPQEPRLCRPTWCDIPRLLVEAAGFLHYFDSRQERRRFES